MTAINASASESAREALLGAQDELLAPQDRVGTQLGIDKKQHGKDGREPLDTYDPARLMYPDHVCCATGIANMSLMLSPAVYVWPALLVAVTFGISNLCRMAQLDHEWTIATESGSAALGTVVAFVIGTFLATVVSQWKGRRAQYTSLSGASRDLLLQLGTIVSGEQSSSDADGERREAARERLGRYVLLAVELAYAKAHDAMDDNSTRLALEARGLLRAGEWEVMPASERHTIVYGWIHSEALQMSRRGVMNATEFYFIAQGVIKARALASDLMSSMASDLPCASHPARLPPLRTPARPGNRLHFLVRPPTTSYVLPHLPGTRTRPT